MIALKSRPRVDWVTKTVKLAAGTERLEHYDFRQRLQLVEEPDGSSLRYRYDGDGQLRALEHSSGAAVKFTRTERELCAELPGCRTRVRFDERGFPERLTLELGVHTYTVEYRRDERGRVTAMRYPQAVEWLQVGKELRAGSQVYARVAPPEIRLANGTTTREEWTGDRHLTRIAHFDAAGRPAHDAAYEYDGERLASAGEQRFAYDERRRLVRCNDREYRFDQAGRLVRAGAKAFAYDEGWVVRQSGGARFDYDPLGRRTRRTDAAGTTRYGYDLFGQLASVQLPGGRQVRYLHDGFGRLVGRDDVRYVVDLDGKRLAECDASGRVRRSYLWLGAQCLGVVDGPCGGPLARSFHRVHGGTLVGVGDAGGHIRPVAGQDPYGADHPIVDGVPGYAGLFGDPETGLLLATTRWLDPDLAQFITPDSWQGTHALDHLPRGLRRVTDLLPGGTAGPFDAVIAYGWCGYDPVNYSDPSGHSVLGIIWSVISAFLWQMQVTSVALQMEVISLVVWILLTFPVFMFAWDTEGWKRLSPFNAIPPLLASERLNVPFAFPLNSVWNASGAVFTMGSVIWVAGHQLEILEKTAQRDLLICSNAAEYVAAAEAVAADAPRARSPHVRANGTVNVAGDRVTAVTVSLPAGGAVGTVFQNDDWVSIRLAGAPGDEVRRVSVVGADLSFGVALPAALQNQPVEVVRLDQAVLRLQKDDTTLARSVALVRGTAFHFRNQLGEGAPTEGLAVREYLPSGDRRITRAEAQREAFIVRLAVAADQALFAATNFLRVRAGTTHFARVVGRLRGTRDLVLETALPPPAQPSDYVVVEVVKLDPGAQAAAQAASGARTDAGRLTDLRKLDGVSVDSAGAVERRIVLKLFLRCVVTALPAELQGVALSVELMDLDNSVRADGTTSGASDVTTAADEAGRFRRDQPVRVRSAANVDFFTVVSAVDADNDLLTFSEPLPAGFAAGTVVTVTLMAAGRRFATEASAGTDLLVELEDPALLADQNVLRVRNPSGGAGGALRVITGAPVVVAELDSALPGSHTANLTVTRFVPAADTLRANASAPLVQLRFTIQGGANPYRQDDELHFRDGEEGYGRVLANPTGQDIFLVDPLEIPVGTASSAGGVATFTGITVQHLTPTGRSTSDGRLDESLIMIPSDPDEELINRRRAVESHEMRHVWQYAVLGPFFFSMPIPWLISLGFSFGDNAHSVSQLFRHISVGFIDSLIALVAWGIGSRQGEIVLEGELGADLKQVTFGEGDLGSFTAGSPCQVNKGSLDVFNIIDATADRRITLRFSLDSNRFASGDRIKVSVSAFDKIRSVVNKYFSLNLERLWSDHIPQSWGRALSRFLNRDSWFPLLGLYPLGFAISGFNQSRMHFEQDASYHSGDLYNDLAVSNPSEIFVGQFSRLMGFIAGRGAGDTATGLSDIQNPLGTITVEVPSGVAVGAIAGAVDNGTGRARFRETHQIPIRDKVENAIGVFFNSSSPGDYIVHVPGELTEGVVRTISFDADFFELRKVKVKPLALTPTLTALFETEEVRFAVDANFGAELSLRYQGAPPVPEGSRDGLRFTAPVLPGAAAVPHNLEIVASYRADHPIFRGPGQSGDARLRPDQLTNLCQSLPLTVEPLTAPAVGPVAAGASTRFNMPIAPASASVTSPLPAGAAVNASVLNGTGRPAELTFFAPDAVAADTDVTVRMVFGSGAITKTIDLTIRVTR